MRRLGVSGSRCNELERLGQQFGNEALYSDWKSRNFAVFSRAIQTFYLFWPTEIVTGFLFVRMTIAAPSSSCRARTRPERRDKSKRHETGFEPHA
jgi:hypothetical protein